MMWASARFRHTHSQNPSRASPSHITLPIWVRVRVRVTAMPISLGFWEWGCTYHCDSAPPILREKSPGDEVAYHYIYHHIPLGWGVSITLTWGRDRGWGRGRGRLLFSPN